MPRPKKVVAAQVVTPSYTSGEKNIIAAVERILGGGVKCYLANANPTVKPGRLPQLAQQGILPVHWGDLDEQQEREMERVLPYRPDGLLRYGDTVIVAADPDVWAARREEKRQRALTAQERQVEATSPRAMSRALGMPVFDDNKDLSPRDTVREIPQ